jgi:hypothetical protein
MVALSAENTPQTVIFEGDMGPAKAQYLRELGTSILQHYRREKTDSETLTTSLVREGAHPDLIEFSGDSVLIGPEKETPPGTVRHLLRKVLPYAPWKSEARVVIFQNAAGIKDEAETALLKTLEEPAPLHYYFMSVQTADTLKETIRSRAVITRFHPKPAGENLPADPWLRFFQLAGADDFTTAFPEETSGIIAAARAAFDELTYTGDDFAALENILYRRPRALFEKEGIQRQNRALAFAVLPLMAALRDRATEGLIPPLAPVVLTRFNTAQAVRGARLIREYLRQLDLRIFGNRPLNQHAVFYNFFFRFFQLWSAK